MKNLNKTQKHKQKRKKQIESEQNTIKKNKYTPKS